MRGAKESPIYMTELIHKFTRYLNYFTLGKQCCIIKEISNNSNREWGGMSWLA